MTKITSNSNTKPTPKVIKRTSKSKPLKKDDDSGAGCILKFIVFTLVVFLSTASYLYRFNINTKYTYSKKGEMYVVTDLYSTLCQQYEINAGTKADFLLIDGGVQISKSKREIVSMSENDYFSKEEYAYYGTYLIDGSQIQVKGCRLINTLSHAEILIIKGEEDWKNWKAGKCSNCAKKRVVIREGEQCNFGEEFDLEYSVTSSENYYIVLTQYGKRSHMSGTYVYSRLTLIKTVYDMSKVTQACFGKTSCLFNLTYANTQDALVRPTSFARALVQSNCKIRVMFWVGIFGILPILLILSCTACCCFCIALDKKGAREMKKKEITQSILKSEDHVKEPPSYESVSAPLPSYDSLA